MTETISGPIEDVQFPTITICNSFNADKWAFMRNLMNLIKFKCRNTQDCAKTTEIREFVKWHSNMWDGDAEFPLSRKVESSFHGDLHPDAFDTEDFGWASETTPIGSKNYKLVEDAIKAKYPTEQSRLNFIMGSLKRKLLCRVGNFDFFNSLGVSPRFTNDFIPNDQLDYFVRTALGVELLITKYLKLISEH